MKNKDKELYQQYFYISFSTNLENKGYLYSMCLNPTYFVSVTVLGMIIGKVARYWERQS
jgi:hypothetical protein